ncbi:MAG: type I polyketide synthase [Caldilineaceae bacterium]
MTHSYSFEIEPDSQSVFDEDAAPEGIAIIGMAGRFPGAANLDEFWRNLRNGVNSIVEIPDAQLNLSNSDRAVMAGNPNYVKMAASIKDADLFDANFFGIFPKEAQVMDPQHRLFLECAWQALEDAGYDPEAYTGAIGVYAGCYMDSYILSSLASHPEFLASLANTFHGGSLQTELGNDKDYLATRVSFKLNLRGPSMTIQTACSTSLVAIAQACQNLQGFQCDMALAGGATIKFPQNRGYLYEEDGMVAPDGRCRTFDAQARGTVFGDGVGVVLLKRLEDALADGDAIYAVIKGWGLNNDGGAKVGYTAPSVDGQAEAIALAQAVADVEADTITYIEAHGTGTPLGDPIEIDALTKAFRQTTAKTQFCAIGSVKTNIGHLDIAAGVAGLIKTTLALQHKQIPPSLHFETPNPNIDFANSPFYVNTKLADWPAGKTPRRAGISSFGVGGTNAHVVVEEAPALTADVSEHTQHLLVLSAKSAAALDAMTANLRHYLQTQPNVDMADLAYTLQVGRRPFPHRRVLVAGSAADAVQTLDTLDPKGVFTRQTTQQDPPVVFMFPGQGAQHVNMCRDLYEQEAIFRTIMDNCCELLQPHLGFDLRDVLYPAPENLTRAQTEINQTMIAQPAIFAVSYALAQLWMARGVQPQAMIGHSVGEFVAACLANVFSLEDALMLVTERGRLMQALPGGAMLAVRLAEAELRPLLSAELEIATINGPALCAVAGPTAAIEELQAQLEARDIVCRPLHTSHAFHSAMMEPAVAPLRRLLHR